MSIVVVSNTDPNPETKESPTPEVKNKDQTVDQKNQSAPEGKDPFEQKDAADSGTAENKDEAEKKNKDASETDESDDSDSEDKEESEKDEKPKKKGGFQRRIDKLNARVAEERQRREVLEKRLAEVERAGSNSDANFKLNDSNEGNAAGKPNPENFETHAEYVEALTDWKIEQREKAAKEKASKSQLETEQQKLLEAHASRVRAFAEKTKDFQDVLEEVDDVPLSPAVTELILSSENGPELMYELAKNRAEYKRINTLAPLAAAKELGKVESQIAANSKEKQELKKITKAPKPIDPVGGKGGSVQKSIYDEDLTQQEYEEIRAKQRRA